MTIYLHSCKMSNVIIFTTNGEFDSLRLMGNSHVLKLQSDVRAKYSRMGHTRLAQMLRPQGKL